LIDFSRRQLEKSRNENVLHLTTSGKKTLPTPMCVTVSCNFSLCHQFSSGIFPSKECSCGTRLHVCAETFHQLRKFLFCNIKHFSKQLAFLVSSRNEKLGKVKIFVFLLRVEAVEDLKVLGGK
jgi:hypothetical protein